LVNGKHGEEKVADIAGVVEHSPEQTAREQRQTRLNMREGKKNNYVARKMWHFLNSASSIKGCFPSSPFHFHHNKKTNGKNFRLYLLFKRAQPMNMQWEKYRDVLVAAC
jgi:hypothetical protein